MGLNVFDLEAKINLNTREFKTGLKECEKEFVDTSNKFSAIGDKLKSGLETAAKVGLAALGAAATGVTALVKQSVSAYAEYEQLVGGVETLFGDSAQKVIENSEKAFATAGMSVNEYMETSINSAAALINSLGGDTEKAAELMDISIQDMSDNVNKMGTTMESVQNAYRGFSRGNFTMLDNLSLGFSGTKEGMEQLLEKAEEFSGIHYDISSYADIVQAIHVVQTEMGITGTTSAEAAHTITGSISSVKAAWKNLTIEMVKEDGDIGKAFQVLGENVSAVAGNMLPRIEQALSGISDFIVTAAPQISKGISKALPKILPSVMKSASSIVAAVGQGVMQSLPDLLTAGKDMIGDIYGGFVSSDFGIFNWLRDDAVKVVDGIKETFRKIDFDTLKDSLFNFGGSLNRAFERVGDAFVWLNENVLSPLIIWAANDILPTFIDGLAAAFDLLGDAVDFLKEPAKAVWDNFLKPSSELTGDVIYGTLSLIAKGLKGIAAELDGVDWSGFWEDIDNGEFFADWERGWKSIKEWFSENSTDIDDFFNASEFGENWNKFWQNLGGVAYTAQEITKNCYEAAEVYVKKFVAVWVDGKDTIVEAVNTIMQKIKDFLELWSAGKDTIIEAKEKITGKVEKSTAAKGASTAAGVLKSLLPGFAEGGRVTRPTVALVGEKEPETIVPDSKRGQFGNTYNNEIHVHIDGTGKNAEQIADEAIEVISTKLDILGIQQQRAVGGKSWA